MSTPAVLPLALGLGPGELTVLLIVAIILIFGAKKLPELASGTGRALRIFKAETKGLLDDDDDVTPAGPTTRPAPTGTYDRRRDDAQAALEAKYRREHGSTEPVDPRPRDVER